MNSQEKTLARKLFQLKIHEANGQKFEDLFTSIMNYHDTGFRPIKAWGNIGDRKNDGYNPSTGVFYQVFAPENIANSYLSVVNKLAADFSGLLEQWTPINEFYFVVNDKYNGVNADCEQAIQALQSLNNLNNSGFITPKDLENILFKLSDDQILSIVGMFPDPSSVQLNYSVLNEIISHVMNLSLSIPKNSNIVYPDWDDKIAFNNLKDIEAHYMNNGFHQVGSLDEYLNNQSNFFADEVKDKVRQIYINAKEVDSFEGSDLFWKMIEDISPRQECNYQSAAIVLISKYFETCDVFEEPA